MQKVIQLCCVLAFVIGCAAGAVGGHYHGVAVTLQGVLGAQISTMEALDDQHEKRTR